MDEEHDSGLPDHRAPWERPIADSTLRESRPGRVHRERGPRRSEAGPPSGGAHSAGSHSDSERSGSRRTDSARSRRAAEAGDPEQLTVAELMNKVGRRSDTTPPAAGPPPAPPITASSSLPPAHPRSGGSDGPRGRDGARPPAPTPPVPVQPSRAVPPLQPAPRSGTPTPRIPGPSGSSPRPSAPRPPESTAPPPVIPVAPSAPRPPAPGSPAPGSPALGDRPTEQIEPIDADPADDSGPGERTSRRTVRPQAVPQAVGAEGLSRLELSKRRKHHRFRLAARTAVAFVSVLALIGTGSVWGYLRSTEAGFSQIAALDTESTDIVDPIGQTGDETYLIVGTDTRAGASGEIGAGTVEDAEGARADTVILVNIPADRSRVVAVSFPRDLDVERPVCRGWDNETGDYSSDTYPAADGDKLNATYALGGPKCLVKVIQKMSGLKIGHFVGVDFAGFEAMVDQIGGVEVCTPEPLIDGELGTIIDTAGTHSLTGQRALDYVRARYVFTEGNGDYGRITRQQKFLSSLLRSALSNKVLLDPVKLNGFINAFTSATFVENVNTESLVKLGRSLQNVDAGAVTFLTVPTAGTNDWGNEIPRLDDIESIFTAIIDDLPLPGEKREAPPVDTSAPEPDPVSTLAALLAVDPSTVSVQVSNASGTSGLAARISETIGAYGFPIYDVGNYSGTSAQTVIRFEPGQEAEAATVASAFPGSVLQEAPASAGLGTVVEVVLGTSFDDTVTAPTPPGTPLAPMVIEAASSKDSVTLPADLAITNAGSDLCS